MTRALFALALLSAPAFASGLADHGEDLFKREETTVKLEGFFRVRGDLLHNLDLDRGTTPSGRPLFAVSLGDPTAQELLVTDMRLRTDVAIYAPFAAAAVKVRLDVLDDLVLGSTPALSPGTGAAPTPAASPGQLPNTLFRLKRAYGEVLTPIGYFAAGRMGNGWGLGMYANGGDCLDCNLGDQADRVAFVTPVLGHLWAFAYDFSAVGPTQPRKDSQRALVFDPSTNVSSFTFALMNVKSQQARDRRRKAGRWTLEYGAYLSYRWQKNDVPEAYLVVSEPRALTPASVMERGFRAGVVDGWIRFQTPMLRVEAEGAVVMAESAQASLIPGVLLRDPVQAFQAGAALEVQVGTEEDTFTGGLNAGFASGDPAPGFGAFPPSGSTPIAGELDAPQVNVPRDTRVDNFRFHPDYRIDRVLFAEIVGTVTDAFYVKPWARARLLQFTSSQLGLKVDGTFTRALFASSTPGGDAALGLELHAALSWDSKDGFDVLAEYAVLFPFAGFDNPAQGLSAQPAQLARVRLAWRF
ncbi:MAG: TIGR04551 family protein [Myxococcota bacterium]